MLSNIKEAYTIIIFTGKRFPKLSSHDGPCPKTDKLGKSFWTAMDNFQKAGGNKQKAFSQDFTFNGFNYTEAVHEKFKEYAYLNNQSFPADTKGLHRKISEFYRRFRNETIAPEKKTLNPKNKPSVKGSKFSDQAGHKGSFYSHGDKIPTKN